MPPSAILKDSLMIKEIPLAQKQYRLWLYLNRFNITIVAGLLSAGLGRLLGPRRGAVVALNPQLNLLSVAALNYQGSPDLAVLNLLEGAHGAG